MCVQYLPKYLWVLLLKVFFNPIHLGAQAVNHVFSVFQQESLARESFERVLALNILSAEQNTFRQPPPFPSRFQPTCFLPESSSNFAYKKHIQRKKNKAACSLNASMHRIIIRLNL